MLGNNRYTNTHVLPFFDLEYPFHMTVTGANIHPLSHLPLALTCTMQITLGARSGKAISLGIFER